MMLRDIFVPVVSVLVCLATTVADAANRPNIIILLADDLGYGELGCQSNPEIPTPHIDSIAAGGVRFTNGYVSAPFCAASRAGLMTGRYQTRFGFERNPIGAKNEEPGIGLPAGELTLAELLQDAGYTTALIGKWHLGGTAAFHPYRHGFDEFFGFMHEGHYFVPPPYHVVTTMLRRKALPDGGRGRWTSADGRLIYSTHMGNNEPDYDADNPIYRGGQPVVEEQYLTDAFTREAVDFLGRTGDRPFFLYLAYNAVHSPLQGADAYMKRFEKIEDVHRRIFAAMLSNLDDSVGAVLKKVRELGIERNTLIFFLSDNGGPTRELTSSNSPLRGEKGQLYEGGIRVPFLVQWKGLLPRGKTNGAPVISLDIFTTAVALAGAKVPAKQVTDGVNLIPYLTGQRAGRVPHEHLYWRSGKKTALRSGDWKIARNPGRGGRNVWELYNLADDISETSNLADQMPSKVSQMEKTWTKLNDSMVDPLW